MGLVDGSASLSELAVDCAAKVDQVVLVAAGATANPLLVGLASLKAGWELGECIDQHLHEADVQATLIECTKRGGTPVGIPEHSVSCQGVKP
jgi:hypothetical protein